MSHLLKYICYIFPIMNKKIDQGYLAVDWGEL